MTKECTVDAKSHERQPGAAPDVSRSWPFALAVSVVSIGLLVSTVFAENGGTWRPVLIVVIGIAIGATLFLTNFGFSSAYRRAAVDGDFSTFRSHALMFATGSILMVPVINLGSAFGHPVGGFATPIGVSLVCGGVLFGIGMQMAGGCASGTLFLLGGGNLKFLLTLATFVIGSTVGAAHYGFWKSLPATPPVTIVSFANWHAVLVVETLLLIFAWFLLPQKTPISRKLVIGALALAILNFATLLVAGRPWSETFGFALWGSKIAASHGFEPSTWVFWGGSDVQSINIFQDTTSVMDFAIILGAMLAGAISRRFVLRLGGDWRSALSAAAGGLTMGYGARLADGCNIGAYFSAIVSGSFSGYVWAIAALGGSAIGAKMRGGSG